MYIYICISLFLPIVRVCVKCNAVHRSSSDLLGYLHDLSVPHNRKPQSPDLQADDPRRVARLSLLFVTTLVALSAIPRPFPIHNNSEMGVTRGCKSFWVNLAIGGEGGMQMNYDRSDFCKQPS